ncbi:hypothetical protein PGT21_037007 [Puccinia graminis f. sp. tritici]|uniref:Uncharacterized protein n=2 Tax=Puccinia graminis f. sp. tritici TaxID=56615 RepID=E3L2W1_PUCGT|nr:uncharacterized protein PGTG_17085 [Puccinia graminis f. sp. tritici CRL 75-36-700-3]EFP90886.2 hypothetical protein PGTG_17085 [Puccinia graminis f. sp. tritici CRL 75-36-700-3]KAA1115539.1 hypothetical protein PGT21_037007 [Puccinia graminis f. sp. tritici]
MLGSFRYSIKQGLEPVLPEETATFLATAWQIGRPVIQKHLGSPFCWQTFGPTGKPPNRRTRLLILLSPEAKRNQASKPTSYTNEITQNGQASDVALSEVSSQCSSDEKSDSTTLFLRNCDEGQLRISDEEPERIKDKVSFKRDKPVMRDSLG